MDSSPHRSNLYARLQINIGRKKEKAALASSRHGDVTDAACHIGDIAAEERLMFLTNKKGAAKAA
jgi:hypothetical protein